MFFAKIAKLYGTKLELCILCVFSFVSFAVTGFGFHDIFIFKTAIRFFTNY